MMVCQISASLGLIKNGGLFVVRAALVRSFRGAKSKGIDMLYATLLRIALPFGAGALGAIVLALVPELHQAFCQVR